MSPVVVAVVILSVVAIVSSIVYFYGNHKPSAPVAPAPSRNASVTPRRGYGPPSVTPRPSSEPARPSDTYRSQDAMLTAWAASTPDYSPSHSSSSSSDCSSSSSHDSGSSCDGGGGFSCGG